MTGMERFISIGNWKRIAHAWHLHETGVYMEGPDTEHTETNFL